VSVSECEREREGEREGGGHSQRVVSPHSAGARGRMGVGVRVSACMRGGVVVRPLVGVAQPVARHAVHVRAHRGRHLRRGPAARSVGGLREGTGIELMKQM
jgi:hypothetical protein